MKWFVPYLLSVLFITSCAGINESPIPTTQPSTSLPALPAATLPAPTDMPDPPTASPQGIPAPQIKSDTWINSQPLTWYSLRGKVVLVEFWTFGCINCRHVTPYLNEMDEDYRSQGLTIIGVHSPEFRYEHDLSNVKDAVRNMDIRYPIAVDNDFANWNSYHNLAWPALYLVDKHGLIRYTHVGEGAYDETRQWIEQLLKEP